MLRLHGQVLCVEMGVRVEFGTRSVGRGNHMFVTSKTQSRAATVGRPALAYEEQVALHRPLAGLQLDETEGSNTGAAVESCQTRSSRATVRNDLPTFSRQLDPVLLVAALTGNSIAMAKDLADIQAVVQLSAEPEGLFLVG